MKERRLKRIENLPSVKYFWRGLDIFISILRIITTHIYILYPQFSIGLRIYIYTDSSPLGKV